MSFMRVMQIGIMLLLGNAAIAQSLDLAAVLTLARNNNEAVKSAEADLKIAAAEIKSAYSEALPTIDLNGGYNRNFKESVFFFEALNPQTGELEAGSFKTSFRNEFRMNAVLRQTVFSFEVGYGIQAARIFDKIANLNYDAVRQEVETNAKVNFYRVLLLKEVWRVVIDSEKSARDNYENIKLKYDSGISSEYDLLQAEVRWQSAIPKTTEAQKDYQQSLNALKAYIGVPIEQEIQLQGSVATFPELPEMMSFEEASGRRSDYQALKMRKQFNKKVVSVEKARAFPRLEATLQYLYSAASDEFKLEQDNDNYFLGLSLNIPIFTGGDRAAQIRKARAEVERATVRLEATDTYIRATLENLHLQLSEARQNIHANEKAVQTARRAFEIAETRVDNGLSTQVELKDSRLAFDEAELAYYSAIFDYLNAYFNWELATGALSDASVFEH